jgi:TatD DNase family protein
MRTLTFTPASPATSRRSSPLSWIALCEVRRAKLMALIPKDRLLTETDHPFGDRRSSGASAPGGVGTVEQSLARQHGLTASDVRLLIWQNLGRLVRDVGCSRLLPRQIRALLAASG